METMLTVSAPGLIPLLPSGESARAGVLARLACQAMIAEAELTPKPGLVDRRGSGSHQDLSLAIMRESAVAIEPCLREMAEVSEGRRPGPALREDLGVIGRKAERSMYAVTDGSNSHKGVIWALGLLVSAAAMRGDTQAERIARIASMIAAHEDPYLPAVESHGALVTRRHGVAGARGEAIAGFPHVIRLGLPTLRAKRLARVPENAARLDSFLSIMAGIADTCVLYRGGWAALSTVRQGAAAILGAGGCESPLGLRLLQDLDVRVRVLGVSPGGSADLLAATLFLDAVERRQDTVYPDQNEQENHYGNH